MSASRHLDYKNKEREQRDRRAVRRNEATALRKSQRERQLISKRLRGDANDVDAPEGMLDPVAATAEALAALEADRNSANLMRVRKLLARGSAFVQAFLETPGAFAQLERFLTNADLQFEAVWCLNNIAASIPDHTKMAMNAAPYLIQLLQSSDQRLVDNAAWTLGNIAADGPDSRDRLAAQGAIPALIAALDNPAGKEPDLIAAVAFALSNFARGAGADIGSLVAAGTAHLLLDALAPHIGTPTVVSEVFWVLSLVTANNVELIGDLASRGLIEVVVEAIHVQATSDPDNIQMAIPLLRTCGNIMASGPHEFVEAALADSRLLVALRAFLHSIRRSIKLETAWVISNICAGTVTHAEHVLAAGLVPDLMAMMAGTFDVKKEAAYALINLGTQGPPFVQGLMELDGLNAFSGLLKTPDPELLDLGLQFIEMLCRAIPDGVAMVTECESIEIIEALQYHDNEAVRQKACELMDEYFNFDEDEPEDGPAPPGGAMPFSL